MENSTEVPQKTRNITTIRSRQFTSGYFLEENENPYLNRLQPHFHRSIIYDSQDMETT